MKENYVAYVIEDYLADGNFDASFGDSWIDDERLKALAVESCNYAFADYGIDAGGKYSEFVSAIFDGMIANNVILKEGDEYSGYWYYLRPTHKDKYLQEIRAKNPAANRISSIGQEALRRALTKIVAEDGLRSMKEKWDEATASEGEKDNADDDEPIARESSLPLQPDPNFFSNEARKDKFVSLTDKALKDVENSELSNVAKSQAAGYLEAARVLSETPDPPVDLIWTILSRANSVAGIGSFFLALIMLIGMVV